MFRRNLFLRNFKKEIFEFQLFFNSVKKGMNFMLTFSPFENITEVLIVPVDQGSIVLICY